MSRALGAAFLSHQVEQLERSVGRQQRGSGGGRGGRRGSFSSARGAPRNKEQREPYNRELKSGEDSSTRDEFRRTNEGAKKDADIVVVDASVLVHALDRLEAWCKQGRKEIIVIPLEALNTLDLLKKGSSASARRARAASRILESQVGTNPRIRVQRDDAFVLWDEIPVQQNELADDIVGSPRFKSLVAAPPEWLRRTICCARWEVVNAAEELRQAAPVAVLSSSNDSDIGPSISRPATPTSSSTHLDSVKSSDVKDTTVDREVAATKPDGYNAVLAVVTPTSKGGSDHESGTYLARYERVDGALVRIWAQRTGIPVLDVEQTVNNPRPPQTHPSPEKRRSNPHNGPEKPGRPERRHIPEKERGPRSPVVEKPIAMSIINDQPVKVLRVLARGEKLDP
ncbi:hypothetical protein M422DRAFT_43078 [Sphaerobolus stellatus SS14]|nr:hypothetical protein M422DRAFT_43078 [Sphaerobolus stellatus SS14]